MLCASLRALEQVFEEARCASPLSAYEVGGGWELHIVGVCVHRVSALALAARAAYLTLNPNP